MCSPSRLQRHTSSPWELLIPPMVSLFFVLLSQFALAAVPRLFPSLPLLAMLPIAGVTMVATLGSGRCCRRLLDISASAPAFVLFSTLFLWAFYISVIREAIPPLLDATANVQCVLLMFGFYRILSSDPGVVTYGSSHSEGLNQCTSSEVKHETEDALSFRVRYCQKCSANVIGYDHHCPAFGNCIVVRESLNKNQGRLKSGLSMDLATGTLLFSLLQIPWQVIFLIWHIYCICFNIKTDEWVNWRKYPEFQVAVQLQPGQHVSDVKFWNPYDRGIVSNIKDFLWSR